MKIYNFNNAKSSHEVYGGNSCFKSGIVFNGKNYIIKYPDNLEQKGIAGAELKYSNSPICEYIGSQLYAKAGFNTHNVILGECKNKIVVACEDFTNEKNKLQNFHDIKTTISITGEPSSNLYVSGSDLNNIIAELQDFNETENFPELERHFWDMFVMDAYIGNPDRNGENWGILMEKLPEGEVKLSVAPVYDNGNSFNFRASDNRMQKALNDENDMANLAYRGLRCYFTVEGHAINPFTYIGKSENPDCIEAVKRVVPRIHLQDARDVIQEVYDAGLISDIQQKFYNTLLEERYEKALLPIYKKYTNHHLSFDEKEKNEKTENRKSEKQEKKSVEEIIATAEEKAKGMDKEVQEEHEEWEH